MFYSYLPFLLALCVLIPGVGATTISYSGNLRTNANFIACGDGCTLGASNTDADYAQYAAVSYSFNVPVTAAVTITTFSYGGGVNGAGTVIPQSGFEPYLSLFDSAGYFLNSTYSGTTCPTGAKTNTVLLGCYDVQLSAGILAAGTYQIAISAFENLSYAENSGTGKLADGFTGLGNLNTGEDLHYAFDISLAANSPTTAPEPSTASLLLLASLCLFSRRYFPLLSQPEQPKE